MTAVWAIENTRGAIFDAMERREVYATTGTRIRLRFFGGRDFEDGDTLRRDLALVGYTKGVPMGSDLPAGQEGKAPSFLVYATRAAAIAAAAWLVAGVALGAGATLACGYESPQTLALGMMNWTYPKSLYVPTAVWQAEDAGLLPPRLPKPAKDLFGSQFRKAAADMDALGARLESAAGDAPHVSVVLVPQVLWTQFAPADGGAVTVTIHAAGPAAGDTVVVTHEKVVRALLSGDLTFETAEAFGLVRLYGDDSGQERVRSSLASATAGDGTSPATDRGTTDLGL
ncbi:MAG: DUF3604 domain-containing protein [Bauldia sp.]|nr:DUF3604 domain-containing protein [Bauldia sp.]